MPESFIPKRISYLWPRQTLLFTTSIVGIWSIAPPPSERIYLTGVVLWACAVLWNIGTLIWNAWVAMKEVRQEDKQPETADKIQTAFGSLPDFKKWNASVDECACTVCCECLDRVEFSPDGTIGTRETLLTPAHAAVIEAAKSMAHHIAQPLTKNSYNEWVVVRDGLLKAVATLRELEEEI